ncbi:MAG: YDG domain-containing protein, partial [Gammaproteobacteria bacterium]|nr:YDG domain-containing protein [Gammaproteobacteria bacterium]
RGPDIIVVDDDATAGGQVGLHLSLAGADGKPITRLEVGKRTDAFLLAEIRSADGERRVAVESALAVDFSLATGDNLLTAADLGSPLLPGGVVIRSGESRGLSARAFSLAPTKVGAFVFQMRGLAIKPSFSRNPARLSGGLNDGYSLTNDSVSVPPEWGALASGYVAVHHSVSHSDAQRWLATLDADDADVNEGDSGLTAAVTLRDAATEAASAFSRAGSGEALTLHYAIVAPAADLGGATAADLTLATASGDAPRPPCARCEAEYDETLTTGSVEIASGASTASIPLPAIVNDTDAEAAERFTLVLTALVDSNGLPPVANGSQIAGIGLANGAADYIIAANDGGETTVAGRLRATPRLVLQEALDLTASIAARRANVSRGVITIMRPENVQGVIRGVVRAIDGTTDGAADYAIGDFFEIPAGEFSTTVSVRARGDDLTERNESFQAEILVTEPLGVAGPASNPEVVLLDTDRPITLEVAEATVSAAEGEFLEIKVQAKQGSDPAPPRSAPVEFILTPSYPASGATGADDLLVTVGGDTRAAASDAELTVTGVLEPDATEASVSFQVADDTDTTDEMMTFTVSLPSGNTVNTLDGAISIGSSAATTATLTAATASAATLVITPTTLTRVYGEAAPTEFAFTVAPQSGSAFATGDSASTTFFDSNPLTLAGADDDVAAAGTYRFQFKDADTSTTGLQIDYATGIDTKYDFVLADAVYTITPKEITFTSTEVDKVYDGSALAPEVLGTFSAGVESGDEAYVYASGGVYAGKDVGDAQTITGFGIGGAQAGNYTLASASSASGDITAREISNLGFDGAVNAQPPGSAAVGTLTPEINRARISADGVVAAEMDDFRAGGLQFTAA